MNMLTSLKTLLFPAAAVGQTPPAVAGAADGIDFFALLRGVTDVPRAATGQAVSPVGIDVASGAVPLPPAPELSQDAPMAPLPVIAEAAPPLDRAPDAPVADESHPPFVDHTVGEAGEVPVPVSDIEEVALPDALLPPESEPVEVAETAQQKPSEGVVRYRPAASVDLAVSPTEEGASVTTVGEDQTDQQEDAPLADVPDEQVNSATAPQIVSPPPVPPANVAVADMLKEVGGGPVLTSIPAVPPKSGKASPQTGDVPSAAGPLDAVQTASLIGDAAQPMEEGDVKPVRTASVPTDIAVAPRNAGPVSRQNAEAPPSSDLPQPVAAKQQSLQAVSATTPAATPTAHSAYEVRPPIADAAVPAQGRPAVSNMAEPKAIHTMSRPSVAEALSLLQLARDQLHNQAEDRGSALPDRSSDPAASIPTGLDRPFTPSMPHHVATSQGTPQVIVAPAAVDLSASLGAQVVDMGVSGQWIDGLARDIASFSAEGAQGRFRIDAGQLGPVQVDIRQGADGAAVSLTVASDVAEQMLRQEGDRLKLDAGLAAVRISDVKVERAHIVSEPSRSEGAGAQTSGQPSTGSQAQGGAWTMQGQGWGQSSAQSHMQGRGHGRENFGTAAKSGGDPAVLNHEQSGASAAEPTRARYA
jgi:flagellar hook-length control protein FliK